MKATDLASLIEAVQATMPADWHIAKGHGDRWEFALSGKVHFRVSRDNGEWVVIGPDGGSFEETVQGAATAARVIVTNRLRVLEDEAAILRAALYPAGAP
jgi:16S rRNA U1498 N3-methylase RsmE